MDGGWGKYTLSSPAWELPPGFGTYVNITDLAEVGNICFASNDLSNEWSW